jgi:hypothetical protein
MRLVVIGGSDAGVSAGLHARELDPSAEVTLLVDPAAKQVTVTDPAGANHQLSYDRLLIGTGAVPVRPPIGLGAPDLGAARAGGAAPPPRRQHRPVVGAGIAEGDRPPGVQPVGHLGRGGRAGAVAPEQPHRHPGRAGGQPGRHRDQDAQVVAAGEARIRSSCELPPAITSLPGPGR